MKKICVLSFLLLFLTSISLAGTINLPKTGQTKCYDSNGTEIACPGTGQDGDIQAGVAWPEPRFTPNADTTLTDNLTGLIWSPNGNIMPIRNPGWDLDGTVNDGGVTWQHALDYVAKLNSENYLGHNDWRLPNVNELESLINANEADIAAWINTKGFTNVQAASYWSSTSFAIYPGGAWLIAMWDGHVPYGSKSSSYYYVWPVRGGQCGSFDNSVICLPKTGQTKCYDEYSTEIPCPGMGQDGEIQAGVVGPSPRFTDYGNGVVTDNLTGLMWTTNTNLPNGLLTWQQALDYVKGMNDGTYPNFGYIDWRLPNRKELYSLTDFSRYGPALPSGHPFTNVQANFYWSSTSYAGYPDGASVVNIWGVGAVDYDYKSYQGYYVWPVRGGQVGPPTVITLSSFTATPSDKSVMLTWITESEIDNAGFNLYRAEAEDGEYVKINSSLIPAQGSPTQGATYQFIDGNVQNRKTYYYKLEDIDLNGKSAMHGPVGAMPRVIYGLER